MCTNNGFNFMIKNAIRSVFAMAAIMFSVAGFAQSEPINITPAQEDWEMLRCLADKDKNEKISQDEVNKINPTPSRKLKQNFTEIDNNKDGVITLQEYADYNTKARLEMEARFQNADVDKSGGLSKAELANTKSGEFTRIKRQFQAMDTNQDGQVTLDERDRVVADKAKN